MYYEERSRPNIVHDEKNVPVVDLRSDTVTKPTKNMRDAMFHAEVGDDVFEEDPTVAILEKMAADLVGMEAGLFVSSGTMANLIAIINHCDSRGCEAYCGESSHTLLHEQGGAAQLAGVSLRSLQNREDGSFEISELKSKLRKDRHHEPTSKLVLVENTINGKIVPHTWLRDLVTFCNGNGLKLHMDGARLFNASVASGKTAKDIVEGFDSVCFCLSKALGAPVGSVLCGSTTFIANARRIRKVLGGGMRQVGILAAAGIVAINEIIPILKEDHKKALELANEINQIESKNFHVNMDTVQTNMVFLEIGSNLGTKFAARLREMKGDDHCIVKCLAMNDSFVRFVFHYDINPELFSLAVSKIKSVIAEMDSL